MRATATCPGGLRSGKLPSMGFHAMVLAHQGGWDEMLLVATPVAIFVVLFRVANARAAAQVDQDGDVDGPPDDASALDPDGEG